MRLIHIDDQGNLSFTKDLSKDIPPYTILSHTWGEDEEEIIYQDMLCDAWRSKKARAKLDFCVAQTKKDGMKHFWVDTCW
jgi:hypothetical protein